MNPNVYTEMAAMQDQHWWFIARRRIIAGVIGQMPLPTPAKILEIGCGTGGNLTMLAAFGHLHAMEFNEQARAIASNFGICPVISGGLPEPVPFQDGTFDLVCMLDVLEHIEDDYTALIRAKRLLKPSGLLLITVPAYDWLWSPHDEAHHHFRRYTAKTLRRQAQTAGLAISRLGYFNSLLFPLIATIRITSKLLGNKQSDVALPSPFVNTLLNKIFSFERYVIRKKLFPFGTSVLAVLSIE